MRRVQKLPASKGLGVNVPRVLTRDRFYSCSMLVVLVFKSPMPTVWGAEAYDSGACKNVPGQKKNVIQTSGNNSVTLNPAGEPLGYGCWVRRMDTCPFRIDKGHDRHITADVTLENCQNTWASLWLYPMEENYADPNRHEKEIDIFEICGNKVNQNYNGSGVQLEWGSLSGSPLLSSRFDAHRFHVNYDHTKDMITTWACPLKPDNTEDASRCIGGGNYPGYLGEAHSQELFLNADIWNPRAGNNTCANVTSENSTCKFSVDNVQIFDPQGPVNLQWKNSTCEVLNPNKTSPPPGP